MSFHFVEIIVLRLFYYVRTKFLELLSNVLNSIMMIKLGLAAKRLISMTFNCFSKYFISCLFLIVLTIVSINTKPCFNVQQITFQNNYTPY